MGRRIQGLLLDIDGTLVSSNDQHARAWRDALRQCGVRVPVKTLRPLIGMGGDKLIPRVTGFAHDSALGKRVDVLRGRFLRTRYLRTIRRLPGSRELIQRLVNDGVRVAIASSSDVRERGALLAIAGVAELLRPKRKTAQAARSKPDPDVVHAALRTLRIPRAQILMVGDTPYDIAAAAVVGIRTIAFRSGGWSDADLVGAIEIHDGPAALLSAIDRGTTVLAHIRSAHSASNLSLRRAPR